MLVLARRINEEIIIGKNSEIRIVVLDIRGDKVRIGIDAERDIPVHRAEVVEAIERDKEAARRTEWPERAWPEQKGRRRR